MFGSGKDDILALISEHGKRLDTVMQIKSANVILYCKKWTETVDFYRTGLSLPITTSTDWFVEFQVTETSRLSVADESRTSIKSAGGKGITITLQVADLRALRTRLEHEGLTPTAVKEVWGAKAFYIFDPDGNRIEFWAGQAKE